MLCLLYIRCSGLEVVYLASDRAAHEIIHCVLYSDVSFDNVVDGFKDRHLYAGLLSKLVSYLCGIHTLGDHSDRFDGVFRFVALADKCGHSCM